MICMKTNLRMLNKSIMSIVTKLVDPIRTSFWIQPFMRLSWGEMIELTANFIAESMYARCDVDGKEDLSSEAFIEHRKNGSALSVEDQMIVIKGKKSLEDQQLVLTFVSNGRLD